MVAEHLPLKALYLYGSYSKGNYTEESDIDIAVVVSKRSENYFEDTPLLWKLGRKVSCLIEPVLLTEDDDSPLYEDILRTGVLVRHNLLRQLKSCYSNQRIIAGAGVIANDFHDRKDLTPNVCALYVEPELRRRGIAGHLLKHICRDMAAKGISPLYLITEHTSFYERYGWEYLCMVMGDDGEPMRMYRKDLL